MKTLIVRAESGRVVESSVVEEPLEEAAKRVAREALEEWNPATSEFVVLRDVEEVTIKLPIPGDLYDELRKYGLRKKGESEAAIDLPYYTISFDNQRIGDDYIENKVYVIAPYINEDFKTWVEVLASSIVGEKEAPEGIEELDEA